MNLKEALEIAIDELADAVQHHRSTHKGYMETEEKFCRQLLNARNVLIDEVEKIEQDHEENMVLIDKRELALAAYKNQWAYDIRKKASEAFATIENEELYDGL